MGTPEEANFPESRKTPGGGHPPMTAWAAGAAVLPAAAALIGRMRAIDLAYHVRTGELIIRTGDLVRADPFTFTRSGRPWLNQQWGAQVVFAAAHRALGWAGIALAYASALGAAFAFLYGCCRRAGGAPRTAGTLAVMGFVVGVASSGARPQVLALPLFTGTWLLLSRRDRWSWLVPVLAAIWANVHGSFVLAPVVASLALVEDVVARRPAGRSTTIALATAAATFVTPFGPAVWSYAFDVVGDETLRSTVTEWRSPTLTSASGALFWLSALAVVAAALSRRGSIRAIDAVRLIVFFALGATAERSSVWWALAAPPVVASWFPAVVGEPTASARRWRRVLPAVGASIVVLAIAFSARMGVDPVTRAPARLASDAPEVLVRATRRALPAGSRLLVFQPFASWFEFSLPGYPVMVDSRIELFPDEVWEDYHTVILAGDGWEGILERYRITGIVLPPGAVLADELRAEPAWRRVTDGLAGSVFVRR